MRELLRQAIAADDVTIVDRRERPSYGYRAVHLIVTSYGKVIEIQVRTSLQHLWAELSEKFSDVVDPAIKYGGGEEGIRGLLARTSNLVAGAESAEKQSADMLAKSPPQAQLPENVRQEIAGIREALSSQKQQITELLADIMTMVRKR